MSKISVLKAADDYKRTLAKVINKGPDGTALKQAYDNCTWFTLRQPEVNNIDELSALLTKLETRTSRMIIRGLPHEEADISVRVRRKTFSSKSTPQLTPFIDVAVPWLMIDVDKLTLPAGLDLLQDTAQAIEHVVSRLPDEFHNSSYHWQLSASAGLEDDNKISVHLWYWLSTPLTSQSLNAWAKAVNANFGFELVDTKLFQAVQAHYTSNPVFTEGFKNPIPIRSGLVQCDNQAVEVNLDIKIPEPVKDDSLPMDVDVDAYGYEQITNKRMVNYYTTSGFDNILATMGDDKDKFHMPILRAIGSFVGAHDGPLDQDDHNISC